MRQARVTGYLSDRMVGENMRDVVQNVGTKSIFFHDQHYALGSQILALRLSFLIYNPSSKKLQIFESKYFFLRFICSRSLLVIPRDLEMNGIS